MSEPLLRVLARMRGHLLDPDALVRAVASGRQKGQQPRWKRVELRYVDLKAGRHLQVTAYDATQAHTSNHADRATRRGTPSTTCSTSRSATGTSRPPPRPHQVRVTKRLEAVVHTTERAERSTVDRGHDRDKERLLPEDDPVLVALGISDKEGRIKPSRQAKYRQVEEFLRLLDASLTDAIEQGHLRRPTVRGPAADRRPGLRQRLPDVRRAALPRPRPRAARPPGRRGREGAVPRAQQRRGRAGLGIDAEFVVGSIAGAELEQAARGGARPARLRHRHRRGAGPGRRVGAPPGARGAVLPPRHRRPAAQDPTPAPYAMLTRHGILRERFADTLTDALRASLLRLQGYRVDVVQFVESQHTPRNTMLRAVRTGRRSRAAASARSTTSWSPTWAVRPRLAELLEQPDA